MKRFDWLLVVLVGLAGCRADLIVARGKSESPFAPVNEKALSGGIVHLDCGKTDVLWILDQCVKHGEKKIEAYCQGPYRITKQTARLDGEVQETTVLAKIGSVTVSQPATSEDLPIRFLFFDCMENKNP